jgi:hypothetical protein
VNAFQPGDRVDVRIVDVPVVEILADGGISIALGDGYLWLDLDDPAITVTRRQPQPRAGELWQHPQYGRMLITDPSGDLWAWDTQEAGYELSGLDMSGAHRLYPEDCGGTGRCSCCEHAPSPPPPRRCE